MRRKLSRKWRFLIHDARSFLANLGSLRDEDGPLAMGIANFSEDLAAIEFHFGWQERVAVWLQMVLDKVAKTIIIPEPPRQGQIADPVLPKVFVLLLGNRGGQIAASLFAMDVILADFAKQLAGYAGRSEARKDETFVAQQLDRNSLRARVGFVYVYLQGARDYLRVDEATKDGIANLVGIAYLGVRTCRRNLSWRLNDPSLPAIKDEIGGVLGEMASRPADGKAYSAPRVELLLRLLEEVKFNLRELALEEARAKEAPDTREWWRR